MTIVHACSSNAGKLAEFALAAERMRQFQILPLPGLKQIEPPEETGQTFEENAVLKALYYARFSHELVFADDSGLEVDALGGAPGVCSARFAGSGATDEQNNALLLQRMAAQKESRGARFVTAIALAKAGQLLTVAHGSVAGSILTEARGAGGFGYDPLFFYPALQRSFGELSDPEKFAVSARGNATRNLLRWLLLNGWSEKT